jgi:hypothetical protein
MRTSGRRLSCLYTGTQNDTEALQYIRTEIKSVSLESGTGTRRGLGCRRKARSAEIPVDSLPHMYKGRKGCGVEVQGNRKVMKSVDLWQAW